MVSDIWRHQPLLFLSLTLNIISDQLGKEKKKVIYIYIHITACLASLLHNSHSQWNAPNNSITVAWAKACLLILDRPCNTTPHLEQSSLHRATPRASLALWIQLHRAHSALSIHSGMVSSANHPPLRTNHSPTTLIFLATKLKINSLILLGKRNHYT